MPQVLIKIGTFLWKYGGYIITGGEVIYKLIKKNKKDVGSEKRNINS